MTNNISVLQSKNGEQSNIRDVQEQLQDKQPSTNKGTTISFHSSCYDHILVVIKCFVFSEHKALVTLFRQNRP